MKISSALAEACPQANAVFGKPDFGKVSRLGLDVFHLHIKALILCSCFLRSFLAL